MRKDRKMREDKSVNIKSRDFWVNIVDFLQQYWALVEKDVETNKANVFFIHEGSGVFARMEFDTIEIAQKALLQNGFKKYSDPLENYSEFLTPPKEPFYMLNRSSGSAIAI